MPHCLHGLAPLNKVPPLKRFCKSWHLDSTRRPLSAFVSADVSVSPQPGDSCRLQCNKSNSEMEILKDIVQEAGQTQSLGRLLNGGLGSREIKWQLIGFLRRDFEIINIQVL